MSEHVHSWFLCHQQGGTKYFDCGCGARKVVRTGTNDYGDRISPPNPGGSINNCLYTIGAPNG